MAEFPIFNILNAGHNVYPKASPKTTGIFVAARVFSVFFSNSLPKGRLADGAPEGREMGFRSPARIDKLVWDSLKFYPRPADKVAGGQPLTVRSRDFH